MEIKHPTTQQVPELYIDLLSMHPVFSLFSTSALIELLKQCTVICYQLNEVIVKEGELIDSIYFIIDGNCEVRKQTKDNDLESSHPVATLTRGEAIGLSTIGLYSTSGTRTATVIALTQVLVLRIDIEVFHQFLRSDSHADGVFAEQLEMLLRMRFIKSVGPFSSFDNPIIKQLAEAITEVSYPADYLLFKMGDIADACYIIKSGLVEISILLNDSSSKVVAELEANEVFGESGVMLDLPRNATARIMKPTTLLRIEKPLLKVIMQQTADSVESLLQLQLNRSRPIRLPNITLHSEVKADGTVFTVLKNEELGKYFKLSDHGRFIWNLLNGEYSLNDICLEFFLEYQLFNPESISAYIINLHNAGFIKLDVNDEILAPKKDIPPWLQIISKIGSILSFRVGFGNADEWITKQYNRYGWIFFTRTAQILYVILLILGLTSFIMHFSAAIKFLSLSANKWLWFIVASLLTTFTIPLHELAHAFTTKYYGRKIRCFGLGWLWIAPFAFCDTSDMWLASPTKRMIVDLAGIYFNLILGSLAGLATVFAYPSYPTLTIILELFALNSCLLAIANLSPALELDGYYALMDFLDKPNLRLSAIKWLISLKESRKKQSLKENIKQHPKEFIYWLVTFVYLFGINTIVPYFVFQYLLAGLLGVTNPLFSIGLMLLAVSLSFMHLYRDIIKYA